MDIDFPEPAPKRKAVQAIVLKKRKGKRSGPKTVRALIAKGLRAKLKQARLTRTQLRRKYTRLITKYKRQLRELYPRLYATRRNDVQDI